MNKKIRILDGGGAAWRARYVYFGETLASSRKVAHLGLDPTAGPGPNVFGSLLGHEFRLLVPTLPWKFNAHPLRARLYQIQQSIRYGLDGRYGWGTKRPT